jgi:DNA-directed RNA polymerase specialized sigma24 family protein
MMLLGAWGRKPGVGALVADETPGPPDYDDARLLGLVRSGDSGAFGVLYHRHAEAASRLARELVVSPAEVDDVVAETFALVLDILRRGDGPTDGFRCYMLAAVRRVCERRYSDRRGSIHEDSGPLDPARPLLDPATGGIDGALMVRAFIAQPERWSALLWHMEIEQESADEVAPLFGLSRDGLGALERRAREGVRQACLDAYIASVSRADCIPVAERLAAYLRYQLSEPRASEVAVHLSECDACRGVYAELVDLGATLRRVVAPAILGSVAASYLSSAGYSVAPAAVPAAAAAPVAPLSAPADGDAGAATTAAITTGAVATVVADTGAGHGGTGLLGGPGSLGGLGGLGGLGSSLRRYPRRSVAAAAALLCIAGGVLAITISGPSAALPSRDSTPLAGAGGSPSAQASEHKPAPAHKATPSPSVRARRPSATPTTPSPPTHTGSPAPTTPGTTPTPTPSPTTSRTAAPDVTLAVSANVYGPGQGNVARFFFQVTDTGTASTGALTATITLPSGSSLASFGGGHWHHQWSCQATSTGATCQHAAISAGQQVSGGILIQLNGSSACGQPVDITVSSGSASASAQSAQDIQCSS